MEIIEQMEGNIKTALLVSDKLIINSTDDAIDLLGNIYYQGFHKIILHEKNITPLFFDLKTQIAGDILQKFSNYRVQLTIKGTFSKYTSNSLQQFISESNKGNLINFIQE